MEREIREKEEERMEGFVFQPLKVKKSDGLIRDDNGLVWQRSCNAIDVKSSKSVFPLNKKFDI